MKNIDNVNLTVANNLGVSKEVVKKINNLYWKRIAHKLINLEDTTVSVKGAFNFTVSRYLINKKIPNIINAIRYTRKSQKFKEETKEKILKVYYDYLKKLLKQRNEVAKLYYVKFNRVPRVNSKSMEESREDSGINN